MSRLGQAIVAAEENGTLVYNEDTGRYKTVEENN